LSKAHQRACNALDLARDRGHDHVLDQLRRATVHLWYALKSSNTETHRRVAEDQLTTAKQHADDEIGDSLQTALDHLRGQDGGDSA
jgi:hypothetical protein